MWKKIKQKNLGLYSSIYVIILLIFKFILNQFNIEFMSWFYYFSSILILIMTIIGTEQLLFKIKNKTFKNISIIISFILFLIIIYIFIIASLWLYKPTHIIEKNHQKFEVTVIYWDKIHTIYYFNYINPLMRSYDTIKIETTSLGSYKDPFETNIEYSQYKKSSWIHSALKKYIDTLSIIYK